MLLAGDVARGDSGGVEAAAGGSGARGCWMGSAGLPPLLLLPPPAWWLYIGRLVLLTLGLGVGVLRAVRSWWDDWRRFRPG